MQAAKTLKKGEQLSLRVTVFNYWHEDTDVLISIAKSADYQFASVDRQRAATGDAVMQPGEHQVREGRNEGIGGGWG